MPVRRGFLKALAGAAGGIAVGKLGGNTSGGVAGGDVWAEKNQHAQAIAELKKDIGDLQMKLQELELKADTPALPEPVIADYVPLRINYSGHVYGSFAPMLSASYGLLSNLVYSGPQSSDVWDEIRAVALRESSGDPKDLHQVVKSVPLITGTNKRMRV